MIASFPRVPVALSLASLAAEGVTVASMTALLANGFEGLLLVPVALELRFRLRPYLASLWVFAQTVLFGTAVAIHWNAWSGFMLGLPYGALQVLVLAASAAFHHGSRRLATGGLVVQVQGLSRHGWQGKHESRRDTENT
jgi:hypothetical protein